MPLLPQLVSPEELRDALGDEPAELAAALNGGGVRTDQPVIAYCGGGISATVDLFALSLTGRDDARLYDGSLTEWSAHPDLPLVTG
jgi:thiosulfate/3-mercaptopyruvate sulfurtransferase